MSDEPAKIKSVTVYLPNGTEVRIPGEQCVGLGNVNPTTTYVDQQLPDGEKRRFIGLPHSVILEPPARVKLVNATALDALKAGRS